MVGLKNIYIVFKTTFFFYKNFVFVWLRHSWKIIPEKHLNFNFCVCFSSSFKSFAINFRFTTVFLCCMISHKTEKFRWNMLNTRIRNGDKYTSSQTQTSNERERAKHMKNYLFFYDILRFRGKTQNAKGRQSWWGNLENRKILFIDRCQIHGKFTRIFFSICVVKVWSFWWMYRNYSVLCCVNRQKIAERMCVMQQAAVNQQFLRSRWKN